MPTKLVMKLTDHTTVAMFMHYVHTEDKPVRDAAELVANRRLAITEAERILPSVVARLESQLAELGTLAGEV